MDAGQQFRLAEGFAEDFYPRGLNFPLGFGIVQSGLLVTATINIHHFVVDAFIWRLRRDPNYQTVVDAQVPASIA